jgi:serine/threonine-protein kinase HipA
MNPVCLSTLKPMKKQGYSPAARRTLWDGALVAPRLPFDRAEFQTFRGENSGRMSISGVQEKISLRLEGKFLHPTTVDGTHLLKPIPAALADALELPEDVPANEHLTMQIATQVFRIATAPCGLVFFPDGAPALVVRRFDLTDSGGKRRQEDFCQLSGRSTQTAGRNFKYAGSYEECGRIVRAFCPAARIALERLFRQIVFNYLVGNGDAHLKNFSLLETKTGDHAPSPAYDLLCTSLHLPNGSHMALDLFRNDFTTPFFQENGFHGFADFVELAKWFEIADDEAVSFLRSLGEKRPDIADLVGRSFLSDPAKARYLEIVDDRLLALRAN